MSDSAKPRERELAAQLSGRAVAYDPAHGLDQARVDGGALALCRLTCNGVRPGKACEHRCAGAADLGIWCSSHMNRMRAFAAAVLGAKSAAIPNGRSCDACEANRA